ncbi:MAG: acetyl-CoA carboxylase carboxyltransferase subunit beta [Alphaproteobacteria bacterium]|nr:acetyl-CoA carboxylase carboxyltransferase subunit beta [Alphaproteobacteria bacterium]
MNWFINIVRPKIQKTTPKEIANNMWVKCPKCNQMLFSKELKKSLYVCTSCGYHLRLYVDKRLKMLFDDEKYTLIDLPLMQDDPLKFRDSQKYTERLKTNRKLAESQDALKIATGKIGGVDVVCAIMDFTFMGGSMGTVVGEGIVKAAELSLKNKAPFITIASSGGARMQEGILSLMQMARTVAAIHLLKEKGIPFISVLADPTTGGVSASFAMLGDVNIAEKDSLIGFAGQRVIEQTIREKLPENFQQAEYLQTHGMVDVVLERQNLKEELAKILNILTNKNKKIAS